MYTFLRFPNFRKKALTLGFDDGVIYDERLIKIFNENGLKSTFFLNSNGYAKGRKLDLKQAISLYKNSRHEIGIHGEQHFSLAEIDSALATYDLIQDRRNHEKTYDCFVRGMAYANNSYNDTVVEIVKNCGIVYARTTNINETFDIPTDWLRWAGYHHNLPRFQELTDLFLADNASKFFWGDRPKLFYVWGHSYEFNDFDNWNKIENWSKKVGNRDDVWYATNIQIYEYVKAYDSLIFSADCKRVKNPSATDLWLCLFGKDIFLAAGEEFKIEKVYYDK